MEKKSKTVNIIREMAKLSVDAGNKDDQDKTKKDDRLLPPFKRNILKLPEQ